MHAVMRAMLYHMRRHACLQPCELGSTLSMTPVASENVAVVSMTRVASRFTMQLAGIILILLGLFTKVGAVMATIPDAVVGGILAMGVCMIAGVSLSNLPVRPTIQERVKGFNYF